jgi:hypothetical protein
MGYYLTLRDAAIVPGSWCDERRTMASIIYRRFGSDVLDKIFEFVVAVDVAEGHPIGIEDGRAMRWIAEGRRPRVSSWAAIGRPVRRRVRPRVGN